MTYDKVISIKNQLKAKQLLAFFDLTLERLQTDGLKKDEEEVVILEMLSDALEEAIENGVSPIELQNRAQALGRYAFQQGYQQHEVEALLTMRPNPNGKRTT